ncbi:uncharacterized protein B0H64DRAFT_132668 [Chaetomium fimeti]|uniref:Uncharacterized protein n=1 Tax=Chaetomium fimeti TaxID=1854472 RepID=A0AAE0LUC9_9PEZI|nr:hypothetical protein B0H64DRAFT_132668 [Chaetomium fimeti]
MHCSATTPKGLVGLWLFPAVIRCGLGCLPAGHFLVHQPGPAFSFMVFFGPPSHLGLPPIPPRNPPSLALTSVCFNSGDRPIAPRFTAGPSPMTNRRSSDQPTTFSCFPVAEPHNQTRIYTEPTALLSRVLLVVCEPLIDGHFSTSVS